jgi:hypothetical protein
MELVSLSFSLVTKLRNEIRQTTVNSLPHGLKSILQYRKKVTDSKPLYCAVKQNTAVLLRLLQRFWCGG